MSVTFYVSQGLYSLWLPDTNQPFKNGIMNICLYVHICCLWVLLHIWKSLREHFVENRAIVGSVTCCQLPSSIIREDNSYICYYICFLVSLPKSFSLVAMQWAVATTSTIKHPPSIKKSFRSSSKAISSASFSWPPLPCEKLFRKEQIVQIRRSHDGNQVALAY